MATVASCYVSAQSTTEAATFPVCPEILVTSSETSPDVQDFDEGRYLVPCAPPCTRSPSPAPSADSDDFPGTVHPSKDTNALDGLEALLAAYMKYFTQMIAQEST